MEVIHAEPNPVLLKGTKQCYEIVQHIHPQVLSPSLISNKNFLYLSHCLEVVWEKTYETNKSLNTGYMRSQCLEPVISLAMVF